MPQSVAKCVTFFQRYRLRFVASVLALLATVPPPAQAQDPFGFFRPFAPPVAPHLYQPFGYEPAPLVRPRPKLRPRPKPAPIQEVEVKKPQKPRSPGESTNPVPELLADSTLRPGDMVMFPDGLRVFTGKPGEKHKLSDFDPVSQAGKAVTSSSRKLVAGLRPGTNTAWSTDAVKSGGKLAINTKAVSARDVETTGSVKLRAP